MIYDDDARRSVSLSVYLVTGRTYLLTRGEDSWVPWGTRTTCILISRCEYIHRGGFLPSVVGYLWWNNLMTMMISDLRLLAIHKYSSMS